MVFGHVFGGLDFVGVFGKVNVGLDEENVVDWGEMLVCIAKDII